MHDGHEGEQVSVCVTLEQFSYFNKATEKLYTVQNTPRSYDSENDSLGQRQVPISGGNEHANKNMQNCTSNVIKYTKI